MRIGIDCRLWNESGVGRYVRNLVEQLQSLDYKNDYVLFVGRKDREEILKQVQNDNFSIVNADIRWHTLEEQIKFPSIINGENLDLMHFPYFSVPIFYNKPYVVTIHDLILHHFPTGLASTLPFYLHKLKLLGYKFVIKKAAQNTKKIITVSNATKDEIIDHLKVKPSKVEVTYEGIDDKIRNSIRQLTDEIRNNFQNTKYFLYVGNAYPHKNLDRLVQALSILVSQYPNISLVLVGKEDYFYKRLKEKVKKMNLEKSVLFYGEVSDEELVGLYKNALALVMPSLMEGFGLPGLEAMANKCLVLASDIPSLHEVYENAAMYFDPYDVKDLVKKMYVIQGSPDLIGTTPESVSVKGMRDAGQARLASRAKRARMTKRDRVEKGLQRAKMFSWEKMAKETLRIYESCIKS